MVHEAHASGHQQLLLAEGQQPRTSGCYHQSIAETEHGGPVEPGAANALQHHRLGAGASCFPEPGASHCPVQCHSPSLCKQAPQCRGCPCASKRPRGCPCASKRPQCPCCPCATQCLDCPGAQCPAGWLFSQVLLLRCKPVPLVPWLSLRKPVPPARPVPCASSCPQCGCQRPQCPGCPSASQCPQCPGCHCHDWPCREG